MKPPAETLALVARVLAPSGVIALLSTVSACSQTWLEVVSRTWPR